MEKIEWGFEVVEGMKRWIRLARSWFSIGSMV